MEGSTSEDDFQSFMSAGSGRFRKFVNSEEEASVPSLSDAQHLEDPNEQVKMCGFKLKRAVKNEIIVVLLMAIVIVMGAGNAVASRIKGQSMGPYNFFSSLGNSVIYVIFYYLVLFGRRIMGFTPTSDIKYPWVPSENMSESSHTPLYIGRQTISSRLKRIWDIIPPFKFFLFMGVLDGLGSILGLIAQPYISGQLASVLTQAIVAFSMLCAIVILGTRYTYWQVWGAFVILCGTTVCLFSNGWASTKKSHFGFVTLYLFSTAPNALSFTLKELVFKSRKKLDIFVVNSTSSLFGLLLWPIFLPLTLLFDQTDGKPFGRYIIDGLYCFMGRNEFGENSSYDCSVMPYPWLAYMAFNLSYNIALLLLLKRASALQAFMALKAVLPVSFLLFYVRWPLIGSSPINAFVIVGLLVVIAGLIVYRLATISKEIHPFQKQYTHCCAVNFSLYAEDSSPTHSIKPTVN